ncbi:hypothetical protein KJ359_005065 [Pestalotiopsis sp. 9143b]|nr:hypothetical protein KJ359_005065 [Pestalotiopsis sp. 9143b]
MAPVSKKPTTAHKLVKPSSRENSEIPGAEVPGHLGHVDPELDAVKPAAMLTQDELQFVIEAKASGMIDHLMEISKLPATDITLDELKSATQDHDQYVESLAKKASAIQLNLDRCKTLMQSSDNWTKDRLEAKNAKLDALKAAKARLEAAADLDEQELKGAITQHSSRIEHFVSGPSNGATSGNGIQSNPSLSSVADDHFFGKLLDKLQALGLEIRVTNDGKELVKTARYYSNLQVQAHILGWRGGSLTLCREVMLSVVSCKRSLNRILKEASDKYGDVPTAHKSRARASEAELQALLEETNSLWEEVVPVAHMAVEKTMLEPILKLVNTKMEAQDYQNAIIGSYIGNCLSYMNERLVTLSSRISTALHHHYALLNTFDCHQALRVTKPTDASHTQITNPAGSLRQSKEAQAAVAQVCRGLEVCGGIPARSFDFTVPTLDRVAMLNELMAKRLIKDDDRLKALGYSFEAMVKGSLKEGSSINTEILERLTADSLKGSGKQGAILRDAQTEESLEALEAENRRLNSLIGQVPSRQQLQEYRKEFKGDEIMQRWSGPMGTST